MSDLLSSLGLTHLKNVYHNLPTSLLYEEIVKRDEGFIAHMGPIVVNTGAYTGRSPNDKFIVREPSSEQDIWWGEINKPFEEDRFAAILARIQSYLQGQDVFVQDVYAGADPEHRVSVRVITQFAWHSLFARNMFIRERNLEQLAQFEPDWNLVYVPNFSAVPQQDATRSEVFALIHFGRKLILIGGTQYAGETKKAVFTVLNYILPKKDVLGMHCSASMNEKGETALFFGLSGTGKTTLSASSQFTLIGDDEHGWSERGVFNFEGGCYAKVIRLDATAEPEIYSMTRRFGTILENVVIEPDSRRVDLNSESLTENTRASYPIGYLSNATFRGLGDHPTHILMLTCDAFGVLPPVARLTVEQAMYHFISGYTAKVAGTERGVKEPTATFSPCFGAPFMVLHPTFYARQLGNKIRQHKTQCWLVNTGWNGGPYGEGERINIAYTRAIVAAIMDHRLDTMPFETDPVFGIDVPTQCPGVPDSILKPRNTWHDSAAYDAKAQELVGLFKKHFAAYESQAPELKTAGPGN